MTPAHMKIQPLEQCLMVRDGDKWIYKPKRQRWKTYQKRAAQYKNLSRRANLDTMFRLLSIGAIQRASPEAAQVLARAKAAR